ncbi:hypothetical protein K353_06682 [Kitasatospora sp. SolWspMP-SS2h]|uniref:hypothetical protein n=1 Tax=Kitasatospora sp. SolWspMP-SS2h TaxID=1305729 RepID=UPI000DBA8C44|nr:hypothetical protein [Kitasatospora sp. SolWspMP-SS2h]RAJ29174.1 hypothetical protein K353_06682 [Kitasatospora sp. SolWspMP-SS2h]
MNTTSTLHPIPSGNEPQPGGDDRDYDGLDAEEREAIAEAAGAGVRAAAWIQSLAERQSDDNNRRCLERYARAVERILTREIVLDRSGPLEGELLDELDPANFMIEPWNATVPMDLAPAEQVALAAIGACAPGLPVNYALGADLPRVIALVGHALNIGGAPDPAA